MTTYGYLNAVTDFRRARRRATIETLLARLRSYPSLLLSYDDVRRITGARGERNQGLQEIPIANIVGSVDRYADFTRTFLPRYDGMEERWARVMALASSGEGWPPIEVYQIGEVYFVIDGHHRVSAAREMGLVAFPAYVTEVGARVPVMPDDDVEKLIVRSEHEAFGRRTRLREMRPGADLRATEADAYRTLLEHIDVHRYYMGLEETREIPYEEAVAHWYDAVYAPIATVIRDTGLLDDFSERTEADLYLWLVDHRAQLEEEWEQLVPPEQAAEDLKQKQERGYQRRLAQLGQALVRTVATGLAPAG